MNGVLWKLTLRNMRANRKRTLITWVGTIVSVAMVTAVLVSVSSFWAIFQKDSENTYGIWHTSVSYLTRDELKELTDSDEISMWGCGIEDGTAYLTENRSSVRPYIRLLALSDHMGSLGSVNVVEGRLPEKEGEIAVTVMQQEYSGVTWEVGDTVQMPCLPSDEFVQEDVQNGTLPQRYENASVKEFTVVGIVDGGIMAASWDAYFTCFTHLSEERLAQEAALPQIFFQLKNPEGVYEWCDRFEEEEMVEINTGVLFSYGIFHDQQFLETVGGFITIIFLIIFVGAVSLIFNAFAISVAQRGRQLGLVAATGASKNQLRDTGLQEAVITAVICVPIGFLAGCCGIAVTFHLLDAALRDVLGISTAAFVSVPWEILALAVVISLVMIFLSALIPAYRAAKTSPMDALRGVRDVKISARNLKTGKWVQKLFGVEGTLALKNIKRYRSRYAVTVLSLALSIVLLLATAGFTKSMTDAYSVARPQLPYNLTATLYTEGAFPYETVNRAYTLLRPDDTLEIRERMYITLQEIHEDKFTEDMKDALEYEFGDQEVILSAEVFVLPDEEYLAYTGADSVVPENGDGVISLPVVLLNRFTVNVGSSFITMELTKLQEGDKLFADMEMAQFNGYSNPDLIIEKVTDMVPESIMDIRGSAASLILLAPRSAVDRYYESARLVMGEYGEVGISRCIELLYNTSDPRIMEEDIAIMLNQSSETMTYYTANLFETYEQTQQTLLIVSTFAYGFVVLIIMVCTANIFNTVSTGLQLRIREFAMLRSVGMSLRSMKKMIRLESLLYGIKALLWGLPLGFAVIFWENTVLSGNFRIDLSVPWGMVAAAVVGIFAVTGAACLYGGHKMEDLSIVETLHSDIV